MLRKKWFDFYKVQQNIIRSFITSTTTKNERKICTIGHHSCTNTVSTCTASGKLYVTFFKCNRKKCIEKYEFDYSIRYYKSVFDFSNVYNMFEVYSKNIYKKGKCEKRKKNFAFTICPRKKLDALAA